MMPRAAWRHVDWPDRMSFETRSSSSRRPIILWLLSVAALVFAMVLLGGYTRLTESGLSMVNWHPLSGLLPPLDTAAWQREFAAYQAYPEFQKLNSWMGLKDFKAIYYVEYAHRMLGRLTGLVFLLPFLWFLAGKRIDRQLGLRLAGLFLLGAAQGGLGWFMVKSGLIDRPDVSHYRLTAHLGLAVAIYGAIIWVALGETGLGRPGGQGTRRLSRHLGLVVGLIYLQILLGGLVAGLDAGHAYNSWPLMAGRWLPAGLFDLSPWAINFFDNPLTVQFNHRLVAYGIVAVIGALLWRARDIGWKSPRGRGLLVLGGAVGLQVGLGIATLLAVVPVSLGVAHQAGALVAFTAALVSCYLFGHNRAV